VSLSYNKALAHRKDFREERFFHVPLRGWQWKSLEAL
jgi:hypothetical protein